jgi:TolA-binding protein
MARRLTRKELLKHDEVLDAAVDAGHWLEAHWKTLAVAVAVAVLAFFSAIAWRSLSTQREERAADRLAGAIAEFARLESAGFGDRTALESTRATFQEVADDTAGIAGLTARYYQGTVSFHLGSFDEAAVTLEQVARDDAAPATLRASAQGMLARARLAAGRTDDAIAALQALVDDVAGVAPAPQVLQRIARLQAEAGRMDEARATWQRIVDEFPSNPAAETAREQLGIAVPAPSFPPTF